MEKEINLIDLIQSLKKRWKIILVTTLLTTILSALITFFLIKPKYETKVKLFIGKEETAQEGYNQNDILTYQKLLKTYSEVIKTKDLINVAISKSNANETTGDVLNNLTVVPVLDTQILEIKYKNSSPEISLKLINAITDEFVKQSTDLVPNGNVKVLESASLPEKPVSPNKTINILISFLLGLMVGVGIVFLLEFLDNSFKTKKQIEDELDIPVIGVIPKFLDEK